MQRGKEFRSCLKSIAGVFKEIQGMCKTANVLVRIRTKGREREGSRCIRKEKRLGKQREKVYG